MKDQTLSDWEKRFSELFVRDDGLLTKYIFDDSGDIVSTTEAIKEFIRKLLASKREEDKQNKAHAGHKLIKFEYCKDCDSYTVENYWLNLKPLQRERQK